MTMNPDMTPLTIGLLLHDPTLNATWSAWLEAEGYSVRYPPQAMDGCDLFITDAESRSTLLPWAEQKPWLILLPATTDATPWLVAGAWDVLRAPVARSDLLARLRLYQRLRQEEQQSIALLNTVSQSARLLIQTPDLDLALPSTLEAFGQQLKARRVYLYEHNFNERGKSIIEKRGEWLAPGMEALPSLPDRVYLAGIRLAHREDELREGGIITGPLNSFTDHEQRLLRRYALRHITILPIHIMGEWWGLLGIDREAAPHPTEQVTLRLLRSATNILGTAIQFHLMRAQLTRESQTLTLLQTFTRIVQGWTEAQNLSDLGTLALREVCHVIQAPHGVIWLNAPQSDHLDLMATYGYSPEQQAIPGVVTLRRDEGLAGWVFTTRQSACVADVRQDPHWVHKGRIDEDVIAALSVPLVNRDEAIGVMTFTHPQAGFFTLRHVALAESIATIIAAVVANARLYAESQRRTREAHLLRDMTIQLTRNLDTTTVIESILTLLQEAVPYDSAVIHRYDAERQQLIRLGARGTLFDQIELPQKAPLSMDKDCPHTRIMTRGEPLLIADTHSAYAGKQHAHFGTIPGRSLLGVPLTTGRGMTGMLLLIKAEADYYTPHHLRLLNAFAAAAAIALENSELFALEQAQRHLAEALMHAAHLVNQSLDWETVVERILEQAGNVVPGDSFNVMILEGDHVHMVYRLADQENGSRIPQDIPLSSLPLLQHVLETGAPLILDDTAQDARWVPLESARDVRSYLCVPIRYGAKIMGFLNANGRARAQFTPRMVDHLQAFADQVATALEHARLYEQLRAYAEELEQRVAERTQHLRAQTARLAAVLSSINEGLMVLRSDGTPLLTNPVARQWLEEALPEEDLQKLMVTLQDLAARSAERPTATLELNGLDLHLRAAPVTWSETGSPDSVVTLTDVTPIRDLERMKSRFITSISHEMRTPLTTIRLYIRLLERATPERSAEYVQAIKAESERLITMFEAILQLSRLEAGQVGLLFQPFNLAELVEQVVESFLGRAQQEAITLNFIQPEAPLIIHADRSQLTLAIQHLINNAILYNSRSGEVNVTLMRDTSHHPPRACLRVCDTGIGIPEEELPHIFERFYRGEQPVAMQISGTGLGLPIVQAIVKLHRGEISVESKPGEGTCFTIWLPLPKDEEKQTHF